MTYNEILNRIEKALLANFDEVTEHDEPYICLSLIDEFSMPKCYYGLDEDFVDELSGELQPDGSIEGIIVCISRKRKDCTERIDEIDLADLEDDELRALAETVEMHKGERKVYGHLQLITWFRSFCFDIANSGKHGTYPTDIGKFNEEVEKGFSDNSESWTAIDGYHIESAIKKILEPKNK